MTQQKTLVLVPGELPRRIVLRCTEGREVREVTYLLRVTRSGGLLLNKDETAPSATKSA